MYSLTIGEINNIKKLLDNNDQYDYFIETGTFIGETLDNLRFYFKKLRSVELLQQFFDITTEKKIAQNWNNVELYLGDSSNLLSTMIEGLDNNVIFFLDGHRSGGVSSDINKDCPLLEELTIIKEQRSKYNDIIIIDDFRMFGTNANENWSDITINNISKLIDGKKHFEFNDRYIIGS